MNGVLEGGGGGNNFTLPLANIIFEICRGSTLKIGTFFKSSRSLQYKLAFGNFCVYDVRWFMCDGCPFNMYSSWNIGNSSSGLLAHCWHWL